MPDTPTAPGALHHTRPTALHQRIRDELRARIHSGALQPHDRVPSESALMGQYGVSRITVRHAVSGLEQEQLVVKVPGKGAYVTAPKPFQALSRLQGFAEAMGAAGHTTYNQVLGLRKVQAPEQVRQKLQLGTDAAVIEIQRLRYLNRQPVSLDITWVPAHLGERLAQADLASRDIFLILEHDFGLTLGHADLVIDATLADAHSASLLGVNTGAALLRVERLTHDAQGQPLDYEHLFYRPDNFQYRLRIDRSTLSPQDTTHHANH